MIKNVECMIIQVWIQMRNNRQGQAFKAVLVSQIFSLVLENKAKDLVEVLTLMMFSRNLSHFFLWKVTKVPPINNNQGAALPLHRTHKEVKLKAKTLLWILILISKKLYKDRRKLYNFQGHKNVVLVMAIKWNQERRSNSVKDAKELGILLNNMDMPQYR